MSREPISQTTSSQLLKPGLYIVATPIGNLRDITLRALDVLNGVDAILAEDTRHTQKLLQAYDIDKPLSAYHDHNAAKRLPAIIQTLEQGKSLALVSDAGTPLVSDPGYKLVRAATEAGIDVIPLPGASAILAALVTSGLPSDRFTFGGFPPPRSAARRRFFEDFTKNTGTLIFFEGGSRILECLKDMADVFSNRNAVLARELTKRFEETRRATLPGLIESVIITPPKGELVILLSPPLTADIWDEAAIDIALHAAISEHGVKRASVDIAEKSGWAKRNVYQRALELKP